MSNVYRFPVTEAVEAHRPKMGIYRACPQCGSDWGPDHVVVCMDCGKIHTSKTCDKALTKKICCVEVCKSTNLSWALPFDGINAGEIIHYCSPQQRQSLGWWKKCKEDGVHVHQRCDRCGWRGIAMVDAK